MTQPWEVSPTGARGEIAAAIAAVLPRIDTDRLVLRAPALQDAVAYSAIVQSDRWHNDAEVTTEDAWLDFCQLVAGWSLRGTGALTMETSDGTIVGFVLINHEFGDPEIELGWMLTAAAQGQGYATEAAAALRDHAAAQWGLRGLVSYIAPNNAASIRVAERLGARPDGMTHGCHIYRHPTRKADT